jgi:hypothetical protein
VFVMVVPFSGPAPGQCPGDRGGPAGAKVGSGIYLSVSMTMNAMARATKRGWSATACGQDTHRSASCLRANVAKQQRAPIGATKCGHVRRSHGTILNCAKKPMLYVRLLRPTCKADRKIPANGHGHDSFTGPETALAGALP